MVDGQIMWQKVEVAWFLRNLLDLLTENLG